MLNLRAIMITKNEKKKKKVFAHRCIDQRATIFICVSFRFVSFDLISIVPFWFVCQNVWRKSQCVSHDAYMQTCAVEFVLV